MSAAGPAGTGRAGAASDPSYRPTGDRSAAEPVHRDTQTRLQTRVTGRLETDQPQNLYTGTHRRGFRPELQADWRQISRRTCTQGHTDAASDPSYRPTGDRSAAEPVHRDTQTRLQTRVTGRLETDQPQNLHTGTHRRGFRPELQADWRQISRRTCTQGHTDAASDPSYRPTGDRSAAEPVQTQGTRPESSIRQEAQVARGACRETRRIDGHWLSLDVRSNVR